MSRADSAALKFGPSGPPDNANYPGPGSSDIIAYEFTPTHDISVKSLGFYDIVTDLAVPGAADGLSVSHQVGIFRVSDEALITSGTVQAGTVDPKIDSFRYTSVDPVTLSAGVEYVIGATTGAYVNGVFGQDSTVNANIGSDVFANSSITIGDWRSNSIGDGFSLVFPGYKRNMTTQTRGLGPNFTFSSVPEPSGILLMGMGLAAAFVFARRRAI